MIKITNAYVGSTKLFYVYCPICGDILYENTSDNSGIRKESDFAEEVIGMDLWCNSCQESIEIIDNEEEADY